MAEPRKLVVLYKAILPHAPLARYESPYPTYEALGGEDNPSFCCDPMWEAWKARKIGFAYRGSRARFPAVNIYITETWKTIMTIQYCPFCGAPIEIKEGLRVRPVRKEIMVTEKKAYDVEEVVTP